ncbi:MAG: putative manganese transporter [Oscillospiraceae bacterium]
MWDLVLDVMKDAVIDSLKMLPFLFGAYLLIEFLEHKMSGKLEGVLQKMGVFGPIGGAAIGCVPQCGFSVMASNLYAGRLITVGTLMAVFISTSDEAIPIILANPKSAKMIGLLLLIKVIVAIVAGVLIDLFIRFFGKKDKADKPFEEICANCDCEHHGIFISALRHTIGIFIFVLIVNLVLNAVIMSVGEETVSSFLTSIKFFQPVIAAFIGLIPNCASSVILTQLFIQGGLTFGSLIAGLSTGAGLGLVVLFKANKHMKQNFAMLGGLLAIGIFAGIIVDLIGEKKLMTPPSLLIVIAC